jgi:hypothetical protein
MKGHSTSKSGPGDDVESSTRANKDTCNAENTSTDGRSKAAAEVAVEFLQQLRPDGPWVLTAIIPDGPTETITTSDVNEVAAFVRANDGKRNLYYSLYPTKGALKSKAKKQDIANAEFVHADLDPGDNETPDAAKARYLAALEKHEHASTAIVDSGNGIQALWRLKVPVTLDNAAKIADVEARSLALTLSLGGTPGTQNVDRILRLPGPTNLPNKKKIEAGRVPCPTQLIRFNGVAHPLEAFPPAAEKSQQGPHNTDIEIDTLPISERIKNLIHGIDDPKHPYPSRSERVMAVLVALEGAGCTDEQMAAVIRAPIGEHVRDQSDPDKYLARQIARARKAALDYDVAKLNETYALVIVGDKTVVMQTSKEVKFRAISAFNTWFANRFVVRKINDNVVRIPLAKYWLTHNQRRQYEGLVFAPNREMPNHFNLWQGFAVEPQPGDCLKFLAHIRDNVCRGDESLYKWVIGWFADIVQHPGKKIGTSLVLRGKQGVGKTIVGVTFGSLFGVHYVAVSEPRYITGRFNSHLVSCLLLHADEGFWAGDRTGEGKLKDLVTGLTQLIEYKGKEAFRVANFVRLLVTGNPDWLVPAGFEERRFAVLDVGEDHMQDIPYFKAIDDEMKAGGREALLDYLLKYDLKRVDLRTIPKTDALLEQKLSSLDPEKGWWLDVLHSGELPYTWGCVDANCCSVENLIDHYIQHATEQGARRRALETQIGMFLHKYVVGLRRTRPLVGTKEDNKVRKWVYHFPPLKECRTAFAEAMGQEIAWDETEGEWVVHVKTEKPM